jgi:serine/threonine protein kinase
VARAARDDDPVTVRVGNVSYRVLKRLAVGSLTCIYRCSIPQPAGERIGIFKIARDARSNAALANESRVLSNLQQSPDSDAFTAFLPRIVETFNHGGSATESARRANILGYHPQVKTPDELYTLLEVHQAYSDGMDARDVAWIWRRLLNVLSFCHINGTVHAAVLPAHVLIEPSEHKLILIDWCFAATKERWAMDASFFGGGEYRRWFARDGVPRPTSPALDISLAARCMMQLLTGSSPAKTSVPPDVSVLRHFQRCIDIPNESHPSAGELLSQFDRLIEALWGPRQFRPLTLPPRS